MKLLKIIGFVLFLGSSFSVFAQDEAEDITLGGPYADMSYVIVHSTKDYDASLKMAKEASKQLGFKLNLRDYYEDKENGGLKTDVECGCGEIHEYWPRSDYQTQKFVSIEYSNGFEGFTKGYYIVVIANGEKKNRDLKKILRQARKHYKDAYAKTTSVYMGCSH